MPCEHRCTPCNHPSPEPPDQVIEQDVVIRVSVRPLCHPQCCQGPYEAVRKKVAPQKENTLPH
jgi:hypothetical protein